MKKMLLRKAAIALFAQISADWTPKTCSSTAADIALLKVPGPRLSFQSCLRIRLRLDLLQLHQLFFDLASSRTLLRCSRDRTSWREETVKGASEAAGKYAKAGVDGHIRQSHTRRERLLDIGATHKAATWISRKREQKAKVSELQDTYRSTFLLPLSTLSTSNVFQRRLSLQPIPRMSQSLSFACLNTRPSPQSAQHVFVSLLHVRCSLHPTAARILLSFCHAPLEPSALLSSSSTPL